MTSTFPPWPALKAQSASKTCFLMAGRISLHELSIPMAWFSPWAHKLHVKRFDVTSEDSPLFHVVPRDDTHEAITDSSITPLTRRLPREYFHYFVDLLDRLLQQLHCLRWADSGTKM
jgi:hypothetical protein